MTGAGNSLPICGTVIVPGPAAKEAEPWICRRIAGHIGKHSTVGDLPNHEPEPKPRAIAAMCALRSGPRTTISLRDAIGDESTKSTRDLLGDMRTECWVRLIGQEVGPAVWALADDGAAWLKRKGLAVRS